MNIKSEQLCCYLEGIKVPIKSIKTDNTRNKVISAKIVIPLSGVFIDKMWANAFIQTTYIQEVNGTRKEKLLFQGLCKNVTVMETESKTEIIAESVWGSLNSNTTLDYISPKRYGLKNLTEGLFIHVGPEGVVMPEFESVPGYQLSNRYYYLDVGDNDEEEYIKQIGFNDPEAFKLEFIAQRMPYADRYAFTLFESLAYDNFLLTRVNVDRFNLLAKSKERIDDVDQDLQWLEQTGYGFVSGRDWERTNIYSKYFTPQTNLDNLAISSVSKSEIDSGIPKGKDNELVPVYGTYWYKWTKELASYLAEKFGTGHSTYKGNPPHGQSGTALSYSSVDFGMGGDARESGVIKDKGDKMKDYLLANWDSLKIRFMLWNFKSYRDGGKTVYELTKPNRGNWEHTNHIHVTFELRESK